jgi:hypothetical protein
MSALSSATLIIPSVAFTAGGAAASARTLTHNAGAPVLRVEAYVQSTGAPYSQIEVSANTDDAITIGNVGAAAATLKLVLVFVEDSEQTASILSSDARIANAVSSGVTPEGNGVNLQTGTSYTLLITDCDKLIRCTNGSAITLNIPAGLPVGFKCRVIQGGAGAITFTAVGTTLRSRGSLVASNGLYAVCDLDSPVANEFVLSGDRA